MVVALTHFRLWESNMANERSWNICENESCQHYWPPQGKEKSKNCPKCKKTRVRVATEEEAARMEKAKADHAEAKKQWKLDQQQAEQRRTHRVAFLKGGLVFWVLAFVVVIGILTYSGVLPKFW